MRVAETEQQDPLEDPKQLSDSEQSCERNQLALGRAPAPVRFSGRVCDGGPSSCTEVPTYCCNYIIYVTMKCGLMDITCRMMSCCVCQSFLLNFDLAVAYGVRLAGITYGQTRKRLQAIYPSGLHCRRWFGNCRYAVS